MQEEKIWSFTFQIFSRCLDNGGTYLLVGAGRGGETKQFSRFVVTAPFKAPYL